MPAPMPMAAFTCRRSMRWPAQDQEGKLWLALVNVDPNQSSRIAVTVDGAKVHGASGQLLPLPRLTRTTAPIAPTRSSPVHTLAGFPAISGIRPPAQVYCRCRVAVAARLGGAAVRPFSRRLVASVAATTCVVAVAASLAGGSAKPPYAPPSLTPNCAQPTSSIG